MPFWHIVFAEDPNHNAWRHFWLTVKRHSLVEMFRVLSSRYVFRILVKWILKSPWSYKNGTTNRNLFLEQSLHWREKSTTYWVRKFSRFSLWIARLSKQTIILIFLQITLISGLCHIFSTASSSKRNRFRFIQFLQHSQWLNKESILEGVMPKFEIYIY